MIDRNQRGTWYWFSRSALYTLLIAAAGLVIFYPYAIAWLSVSDPSPQQRLAYLNNVLNQCCVTARVPESGMVSLRRSDIKEVGASTCAREYNCTSSGRRGCREVAVTFYCAYEVRDRDGKAATAVLKAPPNLFYEPFADQYGAWRRETHVPQQSRFRRGKGQPVRPGLRVSVGRRQPIRLKPNCGHRKTARSLPSPSGAAIPPGPPVRKQTHPIDPNRS